MACLAEARCSWSQRRRVGLVVLAVALSSTVAAQEGRWLDRPLQNWNVPGAAVPKAPPPELEPAERARCAKTHTRTPSSGGDRAVVAAGWTLIGPSQTYNATTVFLATGDWDGMCRPANVQGFVFSADVFAGLLTPTPGYARTDGALTDVRLWSASELSADFARYTDADPLCCPSRVSTVTYAVTAGGRAPLVVPQTVTTERR